MTTFRRSTNDRSITPEWTSAIQQAQAVHVANAAGRREDYAWLRDEQHLTVAQAAARLGVTRRTARRWEALRRQEAEGQS
jgi:DNA-binding transcriptional regulator YiaG